MPPVVPAGGRAGIEAPAGQHSRALVEDYADLSRGAFVGDAVSQPCVRAPAVKAAIQGGLVDSLVTHTSVAESLLAEAQRRP